MNANITRLGLFSLVALSCAAMQGCFNMPSRPSQISAAHVSDIKYEDYTCRQLAAEYNSISRRESQLVTAQDERHSSSQMQAFWLGFGEGDGIEASELALVRGEKEAMLRMMEKKGCNQLNQIIEENSSEE